MEHIILVSVWVWAFTFAVSVSIGCYALMCVHTAIFFLSSGLYLWCVLSLFLSLLYYSVLMSCPLTGPVEIKGEGIKREITEGLAPTPPCGFATDQTHKFHLCVCMLLISSVRVYLSVIYENNISQEAVGGVGLYNLAFF